MRLKVRQLTEGFRARWVATSVGLVARVRSKVLLKVRKLGELALTELASVWLNAKVDSSVLGKVARVGKALCTLRALVRLRLAHVHLRVQLHVCFRVEDLGEKVWSKDGYNYVHFLGSKMKKVFT